MTTLKRPKKWMTGDEHDAWLKETGQYEAVLEKQRKAEEEHQKRVEAQRIALIPLMEELHASGCSLSEGGYLTNQPNIPTAVSILLAHFQRKTYPPDARRIMAYALDVPEVKPHWDLLLRLYRDEPTNTAKDGLANAIVKLVDKETFEDVLDLVRDKSNGVCRVILLRALERTKDPRGRATMVELADDPDLAIQIPISLKRLDRKKQKQAERQAQKKQIQKKPTHH